MKTYTVSFARYGAGSHFKPVTITADNDQKFADALRISVMPRVRNRRIDVWIVPDVGKGIILNGRSDSIEFRFTAQAVA